MFLIRGNVLSNSTNFEAVSDVNNINMAPSPSTTDKPKTRPKSYLKKHHPDIAINLTEIQNNNKSTNGI